MAHCLAACGCDDGETITKTDLDRFTDTIENVLNDEKGRRHFRNFMLNCKMRDGRRALDFWEHTERLLNYNERTADTSSRSFVADVDKLIDEAERIDDLDFAVVERLTIARDSENISAIQEQLKSVKMEVTKSLRREYNMFRKHFVPSK